mgnify:CR=1 FL=1
MVAWVEFQFFNPNDEIVKGKNLDCQKCSKEVQKARGCNLLHLNAPKMGFQLLKRGVKHTFCPSKLYKDHSDLYYYFEVLYNCYKTGQPLSNYGIEITKETLSDQNDLIKLFDMHVRAEQHEVIGKMFGGSK